LICESTSTIFPLLADVYYPIVDQGGYGNVKKTWVLDRTIACDFSNDVSGSKENVKPSVNITQEFIVSGRTRTDLRLSKREESASITNILITNIRSPQGQMMFVETSGPRSGKPTMFEVATNEPFIGPFAEVDYYRVVLRRSENQATDI
jgi:hypothetical protein